MFLLQDLPDERVFPKFKKEYPDLDPHAVSSFLRLLKTGSNLLVWLDQHLSDNEISHGKWILLILLKRSADGSAAPSDLARKQGVTRPTISKLIRSLEEEGLVKLELSKDDGRGKIVKITKKGIKKLDAIMPEYYRTIAEKFSVFERGELGELVQILDRIQERFDSGEEEIKE